MKLKISLMTRKKLKVVMSNIEKFVPPLYLRNRHIQTVFGPILRRKSKVINSQPWQIQKNGVVLNGMFSKNDSTKHAIAIFHGLGGHIHSSYVTGIAKKLSQKFSTLRIGLRGSDDQSSQTYHAGLIDDIGLAVDRLRNDGYLVSLVGFSLSATMILKWLQQPREIEGAFVISPPVNLAECAKRLDDKDNRVYQQYFLKKLGKLLEQKKKVHPQDFEPFVTSETLSSIRGFDTNFTARKHGFSSAEAYYNSSSPEKVESIQNQVCIIHSKDDPFIGHSELQKIQSQNKPNLKIHLPRYGGHVGFYAGPVKGYMVDHWALEYFDEILLRNR